MSIAFLIPLWFAAPWLVFIILVIRISIYERRLKLFKDLPSFNLSEVFRRIKEQRAIDPAYNRMKGITYRWLVITASWWALSFTALIIFVVLYARRIS